MKYSLLVLLFLAAGCASRGTHTGIERHYSSADAHPGLAPATARAVERGNISAGMTPAQVEDAWGKPYRTSSYNSDHGHSEQWIYGYLGADSEFITEQLVYFVNGRVTTWHYVDNED